MNCNVQTERELNREDLHLLRSEDDFDGRLFYHFQSLKEVHCELQERVENLSDARVKEALQALLKVNFPKLDEVHAAFAEVKVASRYPERTRAILEAAALKSRGSGI